VAIVAHGSYVGNDTDDRGIAGIGFQPDFVIVKGNNTESAVCKTAPMASNKSKLVIGSTSSVITDGIKTLDSDGFTVGTSATVNTDTVTYRWIAVKANSDFEVGSYTGDDIDNRNIPLSVISGTPDFVLVMGDVSQSTILRTSDHIGDESYTAGSTNLTNRIQGFGSGTFQVGTNLQVNQDTATYWYVAVKDLASNFNTITWVGDGNDNRNIGGVGFVPVFGLVKAAGASNQVVLRFGSHSGDASQDVNGINRENVIQAFQADGLQIGTDNAVNFNTRKYVGVFFGIDAPPPVASTVPFQRRANWIWNRRN
jgi:hypothetical protein